MPSGRNNIYGDKNKALYKAGTVKGERMAEELNNDPARARRAMQVVAREGTTNPSGGRPAVKMPKPVQKLVQKSVQKSVQKPVQVTRTTTDMKSSPTTKRK
jgi:uncharacterized Ntn-hydrolase superfamily protein